MTHQVHTAELLLETIIRFHDLKRVDELSRALLSLIGQSYRPLRVMVVTQRFEAAAVAALEAHLEFYRPIDPTVEISVVPHAATGGLVDARAALINTGIGAMRGRYMAVLDYDDVLYPEAYELLTRELEISGASVALGGCATKIVSADRTTAVRLVRAEVPRVPGRGTLDLFLTCFGTWTSCVADRSRIDTEDLWLDETLPAAEDYDWLLRLSANYPISFQLIHEPLQAYNIKNDGSNTVAWPAYAARERVQFWSYIEAEIERRRQLIVVNSGVQRALGIDPPQPGLTIRGLLDHLDRAGS